MSCTNIIPTKGGKSFPFCCLSTWFICLSVYFSAQSRGSLRTGQGRVVRAGLAAPPGVPGRPDVRLPPTLPNVPGTRRRRAQPLQTPVERERPRPRSSPWRCQRSTGKHKIVLVIQMFISISYLSGFWGTFFCRLVNQIGLTALRVF